MIKTFANQYRLLPIDEKLNFFTHALGAILALAYIAILVFSYKGPIPYIERLGILVFGIGALSLYLASTTYHLQIEAKKKFFWKKIDHISIYLLIGGSYTLFILKYYPTPKGIIFLILHWVIIFGGIVFKVFYTGRFEFISVLLYLVLGWMVLGIYEALTASMNSQVVNWLIYGGVFYSLGILFYVWKRYKINHTVWHLFVLMGTFAHFYSYYMGINI